MRIHGQIVEGKVIDSQTRCTHYHTTKDIIAIKFKCCATYYPCYQCHNETADHLPKKWGIHEFHEKAILCGSCGTELTIHTYTKHSSACPTCLHPFNPRCSNHSHIYFEEADQ